MGWDRPVISAVTGQGVRELVGRMAALVHEARASGARTGGAGGHPARAERGDRRARRRARVPARGPRGRAGGRAQRRHDARRARLHRLPARSSSACTRCSRAPVLRRATWCGSASSASSTSRACERARMRVVAKVGTSSITDAAGAIERAAIAKVTREIAPGARARPRGAARVVGCRRRRRGGARVHVASRRHAHVAGGVGGRAEPDHGRLERGARRIRPHRRPGARRPARLRRPHAVPARPPDAGAAARAGLRADHQRERRDRQRRVALRRQRPDRGARRALDEGRRAGAAHRPRRALHERPAVRPRRRSWSPRSPPTTHCCRFVPTPAAVAAAAAGWRASSPRRASRHGRVCAP